MAYVIRTVGPTESFKTQYGQMTKYTVQFEGADDWVQINQKPESPAPKIGDSLDGTVETSQYGLKFKRAQNAPGGPGRGSSNDPATRTSIERQSSVNAAVTVVRDFYDGKVTDLTLKEYASKVISVATLFERHMESGKSVDMPQAELLPNAEVQENGEIDVDSIPF